MQLNGGESVSNIRSYLLILAYIKGILCSHICGKVKQNAGIFAQITVMSMVVYVLALRDNSLVYSKQ